MKLHRQGHPEAEASLTDLERRCRLLLHAYPAAYRRERGEEILGTLLELTTEGRTWPPGRHVRGLLAGAVRARAAARRRQPFSVNIRTPVLVSLATIVARQVILELRYVALSGGIHGSLDSYANWPATVTAPLMLCALALAWAGCNRVYVFAAAWDAAVAFEYWQAQFHWTYHGLLSYPALLCMPCLAGLVALADRNVRPRPGWLMPAGLVSAAPLMGYELGGMLLRAVAVICIAWIVIDARPAIAVGVFFAPMLLLSPYAVYYSSYLTATVIRLLVFGVVVVLAGWRLSRQSAGAPRGRI